MKRFDHFINGVYTTSVSGATMDVINPATGKKYATLSAGDEKDVHMAVNAAKIAAPGWASTPLSKRHMILQRIADLITERSDEFVEAECIDTGKPISLAMQLDIP